MRRELTAAACAIVAGLILLQIAYGAGTFDETLTRKTMVLDGNGMNQTDATLQTLENRTRDLDSGISTLSKAVWLLMVLSIVALASSIVLLLLTISKIRGGFLARFLPEFHGSLPRSKGPLMPVSVALGVALLEGP